MKLEADQQGGHVNVSVEHGQSEDGGKEMDLKSRREQLMGFVVGGILDICTLLWIKFVLESQTSLLRTVICETCNPGLTAEISKKRKNHG